tara:strand:+ start:621 stop:779 length:159 start_codon:yes stop_codon:yes gene_type:complete
MSNKTNDILKERLFEDGKNLGKLTGLSGDALQKFAETYAINYFEILEEQTDE